VKTYYNIKTNQKVNEQSNNNNMSEFNN